MHLFLLLGGSVPGANPSESAGAQAHQNVNRPGDASHANIGEAFSGVASGTPFSVESGVRLLPLRTVVAMPSGISRAPSGSSSGGVGIIYPFLTRVGQRANTNGNDERNGQSPNEPARSSTHPNQQSIPQSSQTHEAGQFSSLPSFSTLFQCVAYSVKEFLLGNRVLLLLVGLIS
jgi:hypothetical protein